MFWVAAMAFLGVSESESSNTMPVYCVCYNSIDGVLYCLGKVGGLTIEGVYCLVSSLLSAIENGV